MNPAPNLILVGPMGAGKTSIGRRLAERFGLEFVDADQAIVERDGYRYVFVLGEGDVVAQRRVTLGTRQDSLVQIVEGVQADERVVVEGAGFLSDGDRVRVVAATAE